MASKLNSTPLPNLLEQKLTTTYCLEKQYLSILFIYIAGNLSSNEIKEIFNLFDKSNRGQVATSELGTLVRALNLNPTETEIQEM